MSKLAIRVTDLCKSYRIGQGKSAPYFTLREQLCQTFHHLCRCLNQGVHHKRKNGLSDNSSTRQAKEEKSQDNLIWALRDITFDVEQGEVVGIIGGNGAGKSTLLKNLSRITEPTKGSADVYGRIGSLLEVGTGFHPELTGRENIYLNGAILGMKRAEIRERFDEIVEFAEVAKFIDTPVKHFSSGMYLRLAFSVAAHMEPEILIVDEVLAVGDDSFQRKCIGKMENVSSQGRTVLFVSHNMSAIGKLCSRVLWLDDGKLRMDGNPTDVIHAYLLGAMNQKAEWKGEPSATADRDVQLTSARILTRDEQPIEVVPYNSSFQVEICYRLTVPFHDLQVAFYVEDATSNLVFCSADSDTTNLNDSIRPMGSYSSTCVVPSHLLKPGRYSLSLTAYANRAEHVHLKNVLAFEISPVTGAVDSDRWGIIAPLLDWRVDHDPEVNSESAATGNVLCMSTNDEPSQKLVNQRN